MTSLHEQARRYLGVPFKHRGRTRRGLDCAGLPWRCYADLGQILPDLKRYGREPYRNGLMRACVEALGEPVWQGTSCTFDFLQLDDVLLMRFNREPHHMGIVGSDRHRKFSLIHSYGDVGQVVEHGIDELWLSRVCAVFRRPV